MIYNGDYLDYLGTLEDGSVDMVLTDPPFGCTSAAWDKAPDLGAFWSEINRVLKRGGVSCVFGVGLFMSDVIQANRADYIHGYTWIKNVPTNFLNANKAPMRKHEDISVFCNGSRCWTFNRRPARKHTNVRTLSPLYGYRSLSVCTHRNVMDVIEVDKWHAGQHDTKKPEGLLRKLIEIYSNPGEVILDPFMGSGSTAVAAIQTGRKYLGSELNPDFYATACANIANAERLARSNLDRWIYPEEDTIII